MDLATQVETNALEIREINRSLGQEVDMQLVIKFTLLVISSLSLSACSIDSSLFGVQLPELNLFQKTQGAEIVAGSNQYQNTLNNYKVSASAGNVYDKVSGQTGNGYKVYITVQGQMLSEELAP